MAFAIADFDARGQMNSWISPTSGSWENASSWSLGILPGTNQTVMLTNAGFKALQIDPDTARDFPQSLNVNSVVVSSPANGFNLFLMNFSGFTTPLTVTELSVASNSAMTMLSSALQINGPAEGGMTIGGQFNQTNSIVSGNQINVGYIGPGVYNFDSGLLNVTYLWVGGPYDGIFYQNGGTNAVGTVHLDATNGLYVLSNGVYNATTYFGGGTLVQEGGQVTSEVYIFEGSYVLAGGILETQIVVPGTDGFSNGNGAALQTGGTNFGSIDVGSYGPGSYTLSNGVSIGPSMTVDYEGTFTQWGGTQSNTSIEITERQVNAGEFLFGTYTLNAGQLSTSNLIVNGHYNQTGGTNLVGSYMQTGGTHGAISLSDGLLEAGEIDLSPSFVGGGFLTGGTLIVSDLLVMGNGLPDWDGFAMSGGTLNVSNITVYPFGRFAWTGGTISQSGIISLTGESVLAGSTSQSFGPLQLESNGGTNSMLDMPNSANVVRFADSSGVTWSAGLTVLNWLGSLAGDGKHQIIFGDSASALTAQQLGEIQFQNPAGLAPGTYPARILSDGEIVPTASTLNLHRELNGMQVAFQGLIGSNYVIQASTDLVNWIELTDEIDTNGILTFIDTNAASFPNRFYRAALVP